MFLSLALAAVLLCTFCHAPEHAYDELNEHSKISREGLCPDAHKRLLMASTPKPDAHHDETGFGIQYLWNSDTHDWEAIRDHGLCRVCGGRTWKHPTDTAPSCCAKCTRDARLLAYTLQHCCAVPLLTPAGAAAFEAGLPGARPKWPRGRFTFSDYEVRSTRDFEGQPGPRTGGRRAVPERDAP